MLVNGWAQRYSTKFAYTLARALRDLCPSTSTRVAFISSPTAYVAFQSLSSSSFAHPSEVALERTVLFEYDDRFAALPVTGRTPPSEDAEPGPVEPRNAERGGFQKYDLYDPENFDERLRGTVDIAVIDPPYLNEVRLPAFRHGPPTDAHKCLPENQCTRL